MGECVFCGKSDITISSNLEICRECILNRDWSNVESHLKEIHKEIRELENLPSVPPSSDNQNMIYDCNLCINDCKLSKNNVSYSGLRNFRREDLIFPSKEKAYMHGYTDANPTNCCNAWFCPAGSSRGYPKYCLTDGKEYGTYSYAAFMYGCSFDCLFCQNASHKHFSKRNLVEIDKITQEIIENKKITCICYFGGTPEVQLPFTLNLSNKILNELKFHDQNRIMRFCWEMNGSGNPNLIKECMKIAIKTGGNIKFDLKTFDEKLNIALCGVTNMRTLNNFEFLGKNYFGIRKDLPELSGCTLLVPGYTIADDIKKISKFIASINPYIPYSLLVFHPDYYMNDLPITPRKQVDSCVKIAKKYLNNVHLGNKFLLIR